MDSFELNKIAGAILGTFLFVMAIHLLSGAIFSPRKPTVAGYDLPAPEEAAGGAAAAPQAPAEPLPVLLAKADPAKGQASAKKCQACHTFGKGEPNKVGPNLYGVVGGPKAHAQTFNYSAAMKAKGGQWTFEELNEFIHNPKGYVPGTIMAFAGVPQAGERANILAYLHTLSENPVPLPTP